MQKKVYAALCAAGALASGTVWAAGFERATTNSAKYSPMGDAVSGAVDDSQSLFYNPSGLAGARGIQVNGNINGIWSGTTAPIGTASAPLDGQQQFSIPYSIFASYSVNERFAVGVGTYIAGGLKAAFDPAGITLVNSVPQASQLNFTVYEYSIGAGYQLTDGLRVGASWRLDQTSLGRFDVVIPGNNLLSFQDAGQFRADAFKVGIQYRMKPWGIGIDYRHRVAPTLTGNAVLSTLTGTQVATASTVVTGAVLPAQINVAGYYDVSDPLRLLLGFSWTNYSTVSLVNFTQVLTPPLDSVNVNTNWNDEYDIRLGAQLALNDAWTARAGYVWTSRVVPTYRALGTANPPSPANSFALGASWKAMPSLVVDFGGELAYASGDVSAADVAQAAATGGSPVPNVGTYSGYRTTIRLGATYAL